MAEPGMAAFLAAAVENEVGRLLTSGQSVLPVSLLTSGLVRTEGARAVINRVELGTAFDMSKVRQLLTSPPVPCAAKPGYALLFLVLFVDVPGLAPLLCPYVYDSRLEGNDLLTWELVNSKGAAALHRIDDAVEIRGDGDTAAGAGKGKPARAGKKR